MTDPPLDTINPNNYYGRLWENSSKGEFVG